MEVKSLKHNFIMYSLRMVSGVLFTLLVYPYVARTLGPVNLGKIQFTESIVMYFLIIINLGIPTYGVRETSFVREEKHKMSKLILELLIIQFISTTIVSLLFFFSISYISYLKSYKVLFYIFSAQIFLNFLGVEWFYTGIGNQEYITKRSIIFKVLSSIAILLLIRERDDYKIYAAILVFAIMGSNILNFKKLFEYVSFEKKMLKNIDLKKHIKPIAVLFTTSIATSICLYLDSVMVRILIDERVLGYYSVASKIGRMPLVLTAAVSTVLYPRLCNYISKKENEKYYILGNRGLDLSLIIAIPSTIGLFLLAPEIIQLLAGREFAESVVVLRVFSFLITVMVFTRFTGSNLVINSKEKEVMKGQLLASGTNVMFNLILIPIFGATGAALGTVMSEIIAVIYRLIKGNDLFKHFRMTDFNKVKIIFSGLVMGLAVYTLNINLSLKLYLELLILIIFGGLIYLISLIVLKEENVYDYLRTKLKRSQS